MTVNFSAPVAVFGTPRIALNSGGFATYASGSGTNAITFNYTIASGQSSSKLDYSSTSALTLNGGYIYDLNGNVATLTLPTVGTDGIFSQNIKIDAVPDGFRSRSYTQHDQCRAVDQCQRQRCFKRKQQYRSRRVLHRHGRNTRYGHGFNRHIHQPNRECQRSAYFNCFCRIEPGNAHDLCRRQGCTRQLEQPGFDNVCQGHDRTNGLRSYGYAEPDQCRASISASASDASSGAATLSRAEYFIDTSGTPGTGTAFSGSFTSPTVSVSGALSTAAFNALAKDRITIYVDSKMPAIGAAPFGDV